MTSNSPNSKYKDDEVVVRDATREDMLSVAEMIQELADFEKMADGPQLTIADLQRDGFDSTPPAFYCKVAELVKRGEGEGAAGRGRVWAGLAGFALFFPTYSTWQGRALMLEDLYVRRAHRGRGVGERLFNAAAQEATVRGCLRMDFHVLEWNSACAWYERRGALNLTRSEQWCYYRLSGDGLRRANSS